MKHHFQAKSEADEKGEEIIRKEPLAEVEKQLRLHCINLQMVYYRCFVTSVFKSLQMQYSFHSNDVQTGKSTLSSRFHYWMSITVIVIFLVQMAPFVNGVRR